MINLPRQLIYQYRTNIAEYTDGCELNKAVYDFVAQKLRRFHGRMLGIFNDAYYLSIVIANDANFRHNKKYYFRKLGMESSPEACGIAVSLAYVILSFQRNKNYAMHEFLTFYKDSLVDPLPEFCEEFRQREVFYDMDLKPCPCPVSDPLLQTLNWDAVTAGFDRVAIMKVVELWSDKEDKLHVLQSIRKNMPAVEETNGEASPRFMDWMERMIKGMDTFELHPLSAEKRDMQTLRAEIERQKNEIQHLKEAAGSAELPATSAESPEEFCIPFASLVKYAKERHNWDEAKPYVAMLKDILLNVNAGQELIPTVWEIEKYFHEKENQQGIRAEHVRNMIISPKHVHYK